MIYELPKIDESHNPFHTNSDAAASLSNERPSTAPTFFSLPEICPPESNRELSGPFALAPDYAPPAYTQGTTSNYGSGSSLAGDKGLALERPRPTQPVSAGFSPQPTNMYTVLPGSLSVVAPFSRQAPPQDYPPFDPTFLRATGQYLTRGFPYLPPPSRANPHPFATHDVTESDWLKFLHEVKTVGQLTEKQEHWARLPIVSVIPIVGCATTHMIRQQMKKGKSKDVVTVINKWNHHFFNPRRMEIVLMHGVTRLNEHSSPYASTPAWSGTSLIQQQSTSESNHGKGKAKEEEDNNYRLFIMPLYNLHEST